MTTSGSCCGVQRTHTLHAQNLLKTPHAGYGGGNNGGDLLQLPPIPNAKAVVLEVITLAVVSKAGPGEKAVKTSTLTTSHIALAGAERSCSAAGATVAACTHMWTRVLLNSKCVHVWPRGWLNGITTPHPEQHDAHRKHKVPAGSVAKWPDMFGEVP